jgi:Divergent InlB B-repeat domain
LARGPRFLLVAFCAAVAAALAGPGTAWAGTWCGNDVAEANRLPEIVAGNQVHVVYAFPSDGADRFSQLANGIVTDLEAMDAWWRSQDSTRAPRFDLFPFPGCAAGLGRLDLTKARLPRPGAQYADPLTVLDLIVPDLGAAPFGLTQPWAKYLVFYDGPMSNHNVCGVSDTPPRLTQAGTTAAVFLQTCADDLGAGGYTAWTATHELVHNFGAVQPSAPNSCPGGGHTCDNSLDLMGRFVNTPLSSALLDFNHNDYYAHSGSWIDIQDSPWLYRLGVPRPQLTVALSGGSAAARVNSQLPGIACPPQCSVDWDPGAVVRLSAVAPSGQHFVRWQGACTNGETQCVVTMDASKSLTAVFGTGRYRLALSVAGKGVIRGSNRTACARRCSSTVAAGRIVTLRAQPRRGYRFLRWSGACRGKKPTCRVTLSANRSVRAHFAPRR